MTPTLQVSGEILVKYQCFKVSFSLSNIRNKEAVSWHYITVSHVGNTICHHEKKKERKEEKKEKKTFRKVNKMSYELTNGSGVNSIHAVLNGSEWFTWRQNTILRKSHIRADYIFVQLVILFQGNSAGGREYSNLGHVQVPKFNEVEVLANVQTFVRSVWKQLFIFLETQVK